MTAPVDTSPPRILLAEDSRSIATHIARILQGVDYRVSVCPDGQAAWERLALDDGFDAIILDLEMPRLGGMDTLRRIKATPRLAHIPVVMQTAHDDSARVQEGLSLGAYYYLTKPFVADVLISVVAAAVHQRREYRQLRQRMLQAEGIYAYLENASLCFRSLDDAQVLAQTLALACPDPVRAISGLQELLVNAVEHGNLGVGYAEKSELVRAGRWQEEVAARLQRPEFRDKRVHVRLERIAGGLVIRIRDEGPGFDWREYLDFKAERAFDNHGRGIALARALSFQDLRYEGTGNTVVVTLRDQS